MALPAGAVRYALGILALLSVVCLWVSSSFLMNNIFASQSFNKPFFITYVNTASFSLYLLGPLLRHCRANCNRGLRPGAKEIPSTSLSSSAPSSIIDTTTTNAPSRHQRTLSRSRSYGSMNRRGSIDSVHNNNLIKAARSVAQAVRAPVNESTLEQGHIHQHHQVQQQQQQDDEPPLTHREIAELSFVFCILWFIANWATNSSLAYTTVSSSTILSSMSGFFTLVIGAMMKTERFSPFKLIAVFVSVIGVVLVSESDHKGDGNKIILMMSNFGNVVNHPMVDSMKDPIVPKAPLFGDFLALLSAVFYGCYTVLLKVRIRNESRVNMSLFFGYVGLFNLVLLWPMFGVLHWTGVEPFELPTGSKVIWMIVVNALFGTFLSDYLWLLSMLMTAPLVVTLGLSLSIPLALVGDILGNGRVLGVAYWIGAGLVLVGFFGVNGVAISEQNDLDSQEEVAIHSATPSTAAAVAASALVSEERDEERERLLHSSR